MISVIIPTYNYGRFLSECIDSVLAQTIDDWECIIVDNASSDDTEQIVLQYKQQDNRIRYCKLKENRGPSSARNEGVRQSRGEYLLFLDADDLIVEQKLENALILFENNPDATVVYSDMRYFKDGNQSLLYFRMAMEPANDVPWMSYKEGRKKEMLPEFLQGNQMVISSPIFKKTAVAEVGYFDETLLHYEDWDFWLRFVFYDKKFLLDLNPKSYTLIRVHQKSHSSNNALKMWVGSARIGVRYQNEVSDFHMRILFKLKTLGSFFLIDQLLYKSKHDKLYLKQALSFLNENFAGKYYGYLLNLLNQERESKCIKKLKLYYGMQYIRFIITKKLCQLSLYVSRPISK